MMKTNEEYYCDICEKKIEEMRVDFRITEVTDYRPDKLGNIPIIKNINLCPGCYKLFNNWKSLLKGR